MFGRRRHAAAPPAAPAPQLSEEVIFELVHARLAAFAGAHGEWTLTRRTEADTDSIFHDVTVHALSGEIVRDIAAAKARLEGAEAAPARAPAVEAALAPAPAAAPAQHVAADDAPAEAEAGSDADALEPVAFSWEPAPITVWADLRKPVTGEIPQVQPPLVA
ncbi:hypothetical protein OSC27_07045 [Microbacterium sp. STN6]|uniref:hypothetical protein n=1 Tax=Microbacterium sp. STN6 TaxID=2995588 RepID=UPI002260B7A0|nr:hypothetical protein [Microbacterium sp. STN6]MCX7522033.1 hypothetical protein [Microbacterium sp. STN6]